MVPATDLTPCAHCATAVSRRACALSTAGEPLCARCFAAQDLAATEIRAADAERAAQVCVRNRFIYDIVALLVALIAAAVLWR